MSKKVDLQECTDKKLRTIRNNLNNRISSFNQSGDKAKDLQKSHMLFGMEKTECENLLKSVQDEMKRRRS
jgi:hypothetical protein